MSHTKDEVFVICAYENALKQGDPKAILNKYEIGRASGIAPKGVDAICKGLFRSNFIKRAETNEIYLTDNGISLAKQLLQEGVAKLKCRDF